MYKSQDANDVRWNDSFAFLEYLTQIEQNISAILRDSSIENLKSLLQLLDLYMIYLYSVVRFERKEFEDTLDNIAYCIRKADLNQDGKLDQEEMARFRTEIFQAQRTARELFIRLMELKNENGLSIDIKRWKKEMRTIAFYKSIEAYINQNILYGYVKHCPKCREAFKDEDEIEIEGIHEHTESDSGLEQRRYNSDIGGPRSREIDPDDADGPGI
jgi:glutaredoxin-related protein